MEEQIMKVIREIIESDERFLDFDKNQAINIQLDSMEIIEMVVLLEKRYELIIEDNMLNEVGNKNIRQISNMVLTIEG
ncbi:hypothetical protein E3O82_002516 [Enterococcus faecalis]|nr:hypothetical protein [Enterococcus faecalis]